MKKFISLVLISLLCFATMAQQPQKIQKVNSVEILQKGINLHDEGKYREALAEYAKVPFGDQYYDLAVYEKALTQESMEDYRGAIQNINELLDNPSCQINRNKILMLLGDCYDYLEEYEKSVAAYDEALKIAPYDYLTIFNKGVALISNEKYEEALECFKKSIFIAPAHQGSHYRYGLCCLQLGYTVPGILALNFATLINPSHSYCIRALQALDELYDKGISEFNNEHYIDINDEYEELNVFYKDIHQMLNSKAAETQKFHALSKINHEVVMYNQLVFSNIKVRPNSRSVEDMLYVPLFQQIMANKQFNTLCYYQLQETDVNDGKVSAKASKMKKDFNVLIEDIVNHIQEVAPKGIGIENKEGITYMYNDRLQLNKWGKLNTSFKDDPVEEGEWITINNNGQYEEVSHFVLGKANGFVQFYEKGELEQKIMAKDGKPEGQVFLYTPDPLFHQQMLSEEFTIKDNEYEGLYRSYSKLGVLQQEGNMVNTKLDGLVTYYDKQGHVSSKENNANGNLYGQQKSYYPGGQLKMEYRAGNENETTELHSFYIDGSKKSDGFIKNDNKVGTWTFYQPSGQVSSREQYDEEGKEDGEGIQYNSNGNIDTKITANHGKLVKHEYFGATKGVPVCTYNFNNGKLSNVVSYMPDGSVRQEHPLNGKTVTFDLYTEYGSKSLNGTLDADFNWQGLKTNYYPNNQVAEEGTYKDDQVNGERKTYYENGRLKSHTTYQNGKINGFSLEYYNNKDNSLAGEYYFENDTVKGDWYKYYFDGNIRQIGKEDESGNLIYFCQYRPDGSKDYEIKYYHGALCFLISYNRDSEAIARDTLINGSGTIKYYNPEGQLKETRPFVGGDAEGIAYYYNLNGQVIDSANYISGTNNSFEKTYYPTGELLSEVRSVQGDYHGKYKYYTPDGKQLLESTYEYGTIVNSTSYTTEGKLYYNINYTNGERTGKTSYYAPDGKTLLYEIMYQNELPVSISCTQKGGKMSEPVLIGTDDQSFKAYYPNGTVGAVVSFRNGLFNGTKSVYYPNGQAYQTVSFTDDMNDGPTITYYANGNVYSKKEYKEDMVHGEEIYYYPDGKVRYEGRSYYDMPHGEFKTYDKDGKLTHRVVMYYGEPIEDERF